MSIKEDARKCAQVIQDNLIDRIESSDECCLVLMAIHSFIGYVGKEFDNKNIEEAFTGEEFVHIMRRACLKMSNDLKKAGGH